MNSAAPNHSDKSARPPDEADKEVSELYQEPDRPEVPAELLQDLVHALRRLAALRRQACDEQLAPADSEKLVGDFHGQLKLVQRLQRQLIQAKLTPEQQEQMQRALRDE